MSDFIFYLFAAITVFGALAVVLSRSPINSAMNMLLSLVGSAVLFISMDAFFIGILQILVYAGAVMVLFLFLIMLLNLQKHRIEPSSFKQFCFGLIGSGALAYGLIELLTADGVHRASDSDVPSVVSGDQALDYANSITAYGNVLFSQYMLPIQMMGLLLLVAMIGVIIVSKRTQTASK